MPRIYAKSHRPSKNMRRIRKKRLIKRLVTTTVSSLFIVFALVLLLGFFTLHRITTQPVITESFAPAITGDLVLSDAD